MLFAGKRGQGKTTALKSYVSECEPRVFVLDPFDDFDFVRRRIDLKAALSDMSDGRPCHRRVVPPLVIESDDGEPIRAGSREYALEFWKQAVHSLRDCLVVLDEMSLWSGSRADSLLLALIMQGRRLGLRLAVACQRIQLVPGDMLSETTEMVLFRVRRPRDLDVLEEWTDESTRNTVRELKVGECLVVTDL